MPYVAGEKIKSAWCRRWTSSLNPSGILAPGPRMKYNMEISWVIQQRRGWETETWGKGRTEVKLNCADWWCCRPKSTLVPHLQTLNKSHHVPKSFRYLELLFRTESGVRFPGWIATVQNRSRVLTSRSLSDGGGFEAARRSLGTSRTERLESWAHRSSRRPFGS